MRPNSVAPEMNSIIQNNCSHEQNKSKLELHNNSKFKEASAFKAQGGRAEATHYLSKSH